MFNVSFFLGLAFFSLPQQNLQHKHKIIIIKSIPKIININKNQSNPFLLPSPFFVSFSISLSIGNCPGYLFSYPNNSFVSLSSAIIS